MLVFTGHSMHCSVLLAFQCHMRQKKMLCGNLKDKTQVTSKNISVQSLLATAATYCELTGGEMGCGNRTWKLVTENILETLKKVLVNGKNKKGK